MRPCSSTRPGPTPPVDPGTGPARTAPPRRERTLRGGWGWGGSGGWGGGTVSLAAARVILEEVEEQAEEKKHLLAFRSSLHRPRPRPPCPHRGVKMW